MSFKGTSGHKSKQAVRSRNIFQRMYRQKTIAPDVIRIEMICFGQSTLLKYWSRTFD